MPRGTGSLPGNLGRRRQRVAWLWWNQTNSVPRNQGQVGQAFHHKVLCSTPFKRPAAVGPSSREQECFSFSIETSDFHRLPSSRRSAIALLIKDRCQWQTRLTKHSGNTFDQYACLVSGSWLTWIALKLGCFLPNLLSKKGPFLRNAYSTAWKWMSLPGAAVFF